MVSTGLLHTFMTFPDSSFQSSLFKYQVLKIIISTVISAEDRLTVQDPQTPEREETRTRGRNEGRQMGQDGNWGMQVIIPEVKSIPNRILFENSIGTFVTTKNLKRNTVTRTHEQLLLPRKMSCFPLLRYSCWGFCRKDGRTLRKPDTEIKTMSAVIQTEAPYNHRIPASWIKIGGNSSKSHNAHYLKKK